MTSSGNTVLVDGNPTAVFPPAGVAVVVFDVVGTLVEPSPSVAVAYQQAALRHGLTVDADVIQLRFKSAWRRQEAVDAETVPAFATSRSREAERWRAIVDEVFGGSPVSGAIFADLWEHFGRVESWQPLAHGRNLVRLAIDAGMTVALASNFDERLLAIAERLEPLSWVPHVFASSEIGWRKPAPEFFRWVERRLGCEPADVLLVGDDPELDVAAARRAGWRSLGVAGEERSKKGTMSK
jgi:putative hydrolase of the HAD superfamily